ncbi:DUF6265 family protein [Fulvivirgaceae bacterium BMA10]|uniref:DUF6265 family protein n=1 Tax=Splendidivirga corallicola TaxID=3051826 RepID=A0ABT8KH58_9BACT|nr:DUF6265 family protein [Fulvivirgaceae bacterium BMA10]
MRLPFTFLVIIICFSCFSISACAQSNDAKIEDLSWLLGTWLNDMGARKSYEIWKKTSSTKFSGIGYTLKNRDTVFVEKLAILVENDEVFYSANVAHNAGPVLFKLTSSNNGVFEFENPEHDFPKKITYQLKEKGQLHAQISGSGKAIDFHFKKVE